MAEENLWTKLSFDVDLQKGEAKEVESAEQEQVETEEAGGPENQSAEAEGEGEEKKRPSRTERLKRQRDKALQEAEMLRIALAQAQQAREKATATLDSTMQTQLEITKKALEGRKEAAQKAYLTAFEQGDKEALLAAQNAMLEVEVDLRELTRAAPPKREPEDEPSSGQNKAPPRNQNGPSSAVRAWIADNPWFEDDEEMRGAALGIHTKLVREGIEPESPEYFNAIDQRIRKLFPENFDGTEEDEQPKAKPKAKVPPVSSGQNKGKGAVRIRVTEEDQRMARKMGVPLDVYMVNKANVEETGFDPNRRENSYVKIF